MGRKPCAHPVSAVYAIIGMWVRDIRLGIGMTQVELSEKSGFSRSNLSMMEDGKHRIQIENLYRIAAALNVPIYSLLPETMDGLEKPIAELFQEFLHQHLGRVKDDATSGKNILPGLRQVDAAG